MKQENTPGKAMKSQSTDRDGCHISGERWLMIVTNLVLGGYIPLEMLPNDARRVIERGTDQESLFLSDVEVRCADGMSRPRDVYTMVTTDTGTAVMDILSEFDLRTDDYGPLDIDATFYKRADDTLIAKVEVHQAG